MSITDSDDLNDLAGEYVVGTLAGAERVAFEGRLRHEPAAARAVATWASHLQPLADAITPAIPPIDLWRRIERAVGLPSRNRARGPIWIVAAVAAALIAVAFLFPDFIFKPEVNAIAQLGPEGAPPAFVVSVLDDRERLVVRAADVQPQPNQSYELWCVPPSGAPISLGVIEARGETAHDIPESMRELFDIGGTLAVSLEPQGGSPTGAPTTVLYAGTLAAPAAN